jgi:transposase-like protein
VSDIFSAPHFSNDDAARAYLERLRWPAGTVCPHCGVVGHSYKTPTAGRYRCAEKECRKDFTVTVNTPMERSHIALHKWLQAFHLMCSSKKGVSAHQLHRTLGITYRSAWFMAHRIRECMRTGGLTPPLGGNGSIVEADETYYGNVDRPVLRANKQGRVRENRKGNKRPILALVERGGKVRSFHIPIADKASVAKAVSENIARESRLHTDESNLYPAVGSTFEAHKTVKHSIEEYVRYEDGEKIHTNTVEGYFGVFKRGMKGVYQHCKEKHLHRYLAEYDFRYNHRSALGIEDGERAALAIKGADGKRLTYRNANAERF